MASDNFECLRDDYSLGLEEPLAVGCLLYWGCRPYPRMTVLSTLIWNLNPFIRKGRSPLELDSVTGVDWNELFDMNGFSELHKIVCGVSSRSLDAGIDARPEDLDRPDNVGLTPLWHACWLGNSNHIRILIQHGADVNNTIIPLLCAAVWSRSYDSVEQLLNAGASIADSTMHPLYERLMYPIVLRGEERLEEVLAIDKALFGRYFSVDHRPPGWVRNTPLMTLATQKQWPTSHARMRQLLELGANIELAGQWGLTPLCYAIYVGNTEACKILGRAGANANVQTDTGHTILHLAIEFAPDANIIQAVSELDLSRIELGAKNKSGCTVYELFKFRAARQCNHSHLFARLYPYDKIQQVLDLYRDYDVKDIDTELQILLSFQNLLQQVQEAQRIPIEDRYPLLNLTRESLLFDQNEDSSPETIMSSVPGAWPEN